MKKAVTLLACIFLCATALAGCGLQVPSVDGGTGKPGKIGEIRRSHRTYWEPHVRKD